MEKRKNRLGRGIDALLQNEAQVSVSELDTQENDVIQSKPKQSANSAQSEQSAKSGQAANSAQSEQNGKDTEDGQTKQSGQKKQTTSSELPLQTLLFLKLDTLFPNPFQPRKQFNKERLNELSASIREQGILQPLIITDNPNTKQKGYIILAGERRWRAARTAGLDSVPTIYVKASASKNIEASLTENIQRENLNPIELAKSFHALVEMRSCTQEELAKSLGLSRPVITNTLRLLTLSPEIQTAVEDQSISQSHARLLLQLKGTAQRDLFIKIKDKSLNIRETEDLLQQSLHGKSHGKAHDKNSKQSSKAKGNQSKDAHLQAIEQQLLEKFGTRVVFSGSIEKGVLSLYYYSKEDLTRIAEILDVRPL